MPERPAITAHELETIRLYVRAGLLVPTELVAHLLDERDEWAAQALELARAVRDAQRDEAHGGAT